MFIVIGFGMIVSAGPVCCITLLTVSVIFATVKKTNAQQIVQQV